MRIPFLASAVACLALLGALAAPAGLAAHGTETHAQPAPPARKQAPQAQERPAHEGVTVRLAMPQMDSEKGMRLFASKGCVTCHAVNGIGGHDATNLDAHTMDSVMNPFEFAAKMWRMAPYMIAAQEEALGHQVLFTGEELGHIIAFVHDDAQQHEFTEADIPPEIRPLMHHQHKTTGRPPHAEELGHTHQSMPHGH